MKHATARSELLPLYHSGENSILNRRAFKYSPFTPSPLPTSSYPFTLLYSIRHTDTIETVPTMSTIPASPWVDLCNTISQLLLTFSPLSLLLGLHGSTISAVWISSETLIHVSVAFSIRYFYICSTLFSTQYLLEKLHLILLLSAFYVTRKSQSQMHLPTSAEPLLLSTPDIEDDKQPPLTPSTSQFPFHPFKSLFILSTCLLFSLSMVFIFTFDDRGHPPQPNFPFTITSTTIKLISFVFSM